MKVKGCATLHAGQQTLVQAQNVGSAAATHTLLIRFGCQLLMGCGGSRVPNWSPHGFLPGLNQPASVSRGFAQSSCMMHVSVCRAT